MRHEGAKEIPSAKLEDTHVTCVKFNRIHRLWYGFNYSGFGPLPLRTQVKYICEYTGI